MKSKLAVAAICAAAAWAAPTRALAQSAPTLPTISDTVFNVTEPNGGVAGQNVDGGATAVGNGSTNNTAVLQDFINAASNAGGGTVEIPSSAGDYESGTLTIPSGVNLQVDAGATLQNLDPLDTFITSDDTSNVEISGGGIIDGGATTQTSGSDMIELTHVTDLEVNGVTIENASHEHLVTTHDSEVTINAITIQDPGTLSANDGQYLANTDGIDYSGSNFLIENSSISDGDDDIVAKPQTQFTSNIVINDDEIYAGHGISIGGQTNAGMNNVLVNGCNFYGTSNGIHLKAGRGFGGLVQNLTFSNLTMNNVATPFDISSYYQDGGDQTGPVDEQNTAAGGTDGAPVLADSAQTFVAGSTPQWQNLTFSNININGTASTANVFYGLPDAGAQITGLVLHNVNYNTQPANGLNLLNVADATITGTFNAPIQSATIGDLSIDGPTNNPATLTQNASADLLIQAEMIQTEGQANHIVNYNPNFNPNSVNTVSLEALGLGGSGAGTYNLDGGFLDVSGGETIGLAGTGVFNQTQNSINTCSFMYINEDGTNGSDCSYNMSGGELFATVGIATAGDLTIAGDASVTTNLLGIGNGGQGLVTVSDNGSLTVTGNVGIGSGSEILLKGDSTFDVPNGYVSGPNQSLTAGGFIEVEGTPTVHSGIYDIELVVDSGSTLTKAGSDALTIAGAQHWAAGTQFNVTGGIAFEQSNPNGNVAINVSGSTPGATSVVEFQFAHNGVTSYSVGGLNVSSGGEAIVDPSNGGPIHSIATGTLVIDNDPGRLDLNDGAMVVEAPANTDHNASYLATLDSYAAMGYNGGVWNGYGLMSSTAGQDAHRGMGIGILNNDDGIGEAIYGAFQGQNADVNSILIMTTYYGDNTLSGSVNIDQDFADYMLGLTGQEPATWEYGGYTYDGTVDVNTDFRLFALGYYEDGGDMSALSAAVADSAMTPDQQELAQQIIASVPEPSSASLLVGGCIALVRRRRPRIA
ncbi:MAG: glycosyl hydrolase family 28 protein [Tepidisphaeraceae bacterium]